MKRQRPLATGRNSISFYLSTPSTAAPPAQPTPSAQPAPPAPTPLAADQRPSKGLSADARLRQIRMQKAREQEGAGASLPPPRAGPNLFAAAAVATRQKKEAVAEPYAPDAAPPQPVKPRAFPPRPKFYGTVRVPMEPTRQDEIDAIRRVEQRNRMASAFHRALDGDDYEVEDVREEDIAREVDAGEGCGEEDEDDEDDEDEEDEEDEEEDEEDEEEDEEDDVVMNARSLDAKRDRAHMRLLRKVVLSSDEED